MFMKCAVCVILSFSFIEINTKEIRRTICKDGRNIQLAFSGPSLRQCQTKKNINTITTCTLANCPIRGPNICQKYYTIYRLICLNCHSFYIGIIFRPLHVSIKDHLDTRASTFYKYSNKCKNNDNNIPLKQKQ